MQSIMLTLFLEHVNLLEEQLIAGMTGLAEDILKVKTKVQELNLKHLEKSNESKTYFI